MTHIELMTSADVLAHVRNILADTKAEVELDWYNDDTRWCIEVYVRNGDWKHDHLYIKNIMAENGFNLIDSETLDEDASPDGYSAIYYFD